MAHGIVDVDGSLHIESIGGDVFIATGRTEDSGDPEILICEVDRQAGHLVEVNDEIGKLTDSGDFRCLVRIAAKQSTLLALIEQCTLSLMDQWRPPEEQDDG